MRNPKQDFIHKSVLADFKAVLHHSLTFSAYCIEGNSNYSNISMLYKKQQWTTSKTTKKTVTCKPSMSGQL